ncbi:MAG: hypothetical protein ABIP55_04795 [Tepidisphaeraceae bacterium]
MPDLLPKIDYSSSSKTTRLWRDDVAAEWSRFVSGFTRENIISNLKTLAWVVPLTLLIWIYAEREQVAPEPDVSVPFELVNNSTDRTVALSERQDKNLILELRGPQARLRSVLSDIRGGKEPEGLRLEIPANLETNREHSLDAMPLVRNQRLFVENGITVFACKPARLQVQVDQLVEREAKIVKPPSAKNMEATFDPPTVRIRGPLSLLLRAESTARPEDGGAALVVYADLSSDLLKQPGSYKLPGQGLPDVLLRRPPELDDERVTIVAPPIKVQASIEVRRADKTLLIKSMPVSLDVADIVWNKYEVTDFKGVLQNVTVIGPPDIIDVMDKPNFEPRPKARVTVTPQDVGERRSKPVKYDLPDGVKVIDADRNRTVEFRLVDRSTLTQ